ncbi:MAG TPA: hypothetical protein VFZ74_01740 [Burkholderiales bacterium]
MKKPLNELAAAEAARRIVAADTTAEALADTALLGWAHWVEGVLG